MSKEIDDKTEALGVTIKGDSSVAQSVTVRQSDMLRRKPVGAVIS